MFSDISTCTSWFQNNVDTNKKEKRPGREAARPFKNETRWLLGKDSNLHEVVSPISEIGSGFVPSSSPPGREGTSACFITQQCLVIRNQ